METELNEPIAEAPAPRKRKRVPRLNRRRYKEATAALKEIIGDKKQPAQRRLVAIQTLLGIYDRHDRSEKSKMYQKDEDESNVSNTQSIPSVLDTQPIDPEQEAFRQAQEYLDRVIG